MFINLHQPFLQSILGYEKYRMIRNDPCLYFYHKLGPLQFNEKIPGSPDSINNPASVER